MKSSRFKLLVLLLALSLVVTVFSNMAPLTAQAEEADEIREELAELTADRADLQRQMNALKSDIENNTDEISRIADEKVIIDQQIGLISQDILLLNKQILAYSLIVAEMQGEVEAAQARLEEMTQANKERIRTMEEDGNLSYWSVLFRANSFADLLDRLNMVEEIANADRRRLEGMRQARREVEEKQDAMNAEKEALEAARVEMEQRQLQLVEKRAQADEKMIQLKARHEEYEELLEKAEESESKLLQEIAKLQQKYEAAKGEGDPDAPDGTTGVGGAGNGIDMACAQGTPIYASRGGLVEVAVYSSSAGNYVQLNHGDGYRSVYMHMTHYIVYAGQYVQAGQVIGYVGSTGASTGPHLHWGVSYNGVYFNPYPLIS